MRRITADVDMFARCDVIVVAGEQDRAQPKRLGGRRCGGVEVARRKNGEGSEREEQRWRAGCEKGFERRIACLGRAGVAVEYRKAGDTRGARKIGEPRRNRR